MGGRLKVRGIDVKRGYCLFAFIHTCCHRVHHYPSSHALVAIASRPSCWQRSLGEVGRQKNGLHEGPHRTLEAGGPKVLLFKGSTEPFASKLVLTVCLGHRFYGVLRKHSAGGRQNYYVGSPRQCSKNMPSPPSLPLESKPRPSSPEGSGRKGLVAAEVSREDTPRPRERPRARDRDRE